MTCRDSLSGPATAESDLFSPFGKLDNIHPDDIRQTAYELFFTSCRSSPGSLIPISKIDSIFREENEISQGLFFFFFNNFYKVLGDGMLSVFILQVILVMGKVDGVQARQQLGAV